MPLFYFAVCLVATIIGSSTGMGGGVIVRPIFRQFTELSAENIMLVSHITIFYMATLAVCFLWRSPDKPKSHKILPIILGSFVGSALGNLSYIQLYLRQESLTSFTVLQNIILCAFLIGTMLFMFNIKRIPSLNSKGRMHAFIVGFAMGFMSSLLSIGGGFINVALALFVFGGTIKKAIIISLISTVFSQISRLLLTFTLTNTHYYTFEPLPWMLLAATFGAIIGTRILLKSNNKAISILYTATQATALALCILTIVLNW